MSNHKALEKFGRSGNPALSAATFSDAALNAGPNARDMPTMSLEGTVNKTGILLFLVVLSASWTWNLFFQSNDSCGGDAADDGRWNRRLYLCLGDYF